MNDERATVASIAAARERLAAGREGLRGRSRQQTLDSLCALLERFREPSSKLREQLEAELPGVAGFHPATVREGLVRALEGYSGDALRALVERELRGVEPAIPGGFPQTSVLLAGSIPMPSILSLLSPLLLHSPVLAKTASRDPLTARLFAASLRELDPELGRCLEVVSFPGEDDESTQAFLAAGCVLASGSDETLAAVRMRLQPATRLVAYGHRLSLAAIGPEALLEDDLAPLAERLAVDVALWDQLGCLSPVAILCECPNATGVDALASALATALAAAEERWPRGDPGDAARAEIRHAREEAEMRRAAGRDVAVLSDAGSCWTVVREEDLAWRSTPLHRFVRIHPSRDRRSLLAAIEKLAPHLAAVAVAGFGAQQSQVAEALARLGASRICAPGTLQTPPLAWHHDGQPLLLPLMRLTDLEPPL